MTIKMVPVLLAATCLLQAGWAGSVLPSAPMLMMNEDCFHFFLQSDKDPVEWQKMTFSGVTGPDLTLTKEGLEAYIDEIAAGGKITHFLMNVNGSRAMYPTKVWEPVWDSLDEPGQDHHGWVRNLKEAYAKGVDPFAVWIARCREKGVSPWVSVRMNDMHVAVWPRCAYVSKFWREHPELRVTGGKDWKDDWGACAWGDGLDFTHAVVRRRMRALVEEILDRYDPDGIELDMIRGVHYLPVGREKETAGVLTAYMRELRGVIDAAAAKRGHGIAVSVRLLTRVEQSKELGIEADVWSKEGLVDVIVPCNFWDRIDNEIPLAEWREWTGHRARIVPGTDHNNRDPGQVERRLRYDEYLTWSKAMRARGAQDFYLFNLFGHKRDGVWRDVLTKGL